MASVQKWIKTMFMAGHDHVAQNKVHVEMLLFSSSTSFKFGIATLH